MSMNVTTYLLMRRQKAQLHTAASAHTQIHAANEADEEWKESH